MFERIKTFYKGVKGDLAINKINRQSNLVMTGVGIILLCEFIEEMGFDKAQVLAAQVVNYLQGYDIDRMILESEEPLKSRIIAVKDIVKDRAIKVMDNKGEIKEMVVHELRVHKTLRYLGIENPIPSEIEQVDFLLNKYETDIDYDTYNFVASIFWGRVKKAGGKTK
ncbi:MAG: hypothetical protein ACLPT6_14350 [Desulfobaccales bacterium]